jgi:hypothetical protein
MLPDVRALSSLQYGKNQICYALFTCVIYYLYAYVYLFIYLYVCTRMDVLLATA